MKKLLIAFMFISMVAVLFYACKKDTLQVQTNINSDYQNNDYVLNIYHKLQTFKNKVESPLKTDEFIIQDSIVWYVEALLNSTQVFSDSSFTLLFSDSSNYILPVNDSGWVSMTDISSVYNQMIDTLIYQLDILDYDGKFIFLTDVEETDRNSSSIFISLKGIFGINQEIMYMYNNFEDIDDWYYGNLLGRSDGTHIDDSDAGQELQRRLNNPIFTWAPGTTWLTVQTEYAPPVDFPTLDNPYGSYRIFYDETSTSAPILLNEHLDYYLEEAHWILHTVDDPVTLDIKEGIRPEDLWLKAVNVKTNPIGLTPYRHYYVAVYGQPILLPVF